MKRHSFCILLFYVFAASNNITSFSPNNLSQPKNRKNFQFRKSALLNDYDIDESVSVCIVGGGVSGLTAAYTVASQFKETDEKKNIIVLESTDKFGGRVISDVTDDGYILDRGFAVFIEKYPFAQELLDYDKLNLKKFIPGALIMTAEGQGGNQRQTHQKKNCVAKVADPLRTGKIRDLLVSMFAPIGSVRDKIRLVPLILNVKRKSIKELFDEEETDTLTALTDRWKFSDRIIDIFFRPFFEGIYLAPLEEQSSRMFSFVLKMLAEGSTSLPKDGIGSISQQLVEKASSVGVDLRTGQPVTKVSKVTDSEGNGYIIEIGNSSDNISCKKIRSKIVIIATDGQVAQDMLSQVEGCESSIGNLPKQSQRGVGCVYYTFNKAPPIEEPILILSGIGKERGSNEYPINNVCFPSVVSASYSQQSLSNGSEDCSSLHNKGLCSVTILQETMEIFHGREGELDVAIRKQLAAWFPEHEYDIVHKWELKRIYNIPNAQPSQALRINNSDNGNNFFPANVNGGRNCTTYRNIKLPSGIYVCGDHMATASLNGALESGISAGKEVLKNTL